MRLAWPQRVGGGTPQTGQRKQLWGTSGGYPAPSCRHVAERARSGAGVGASGRPQMPQTTSGRPHRLVASGPQRHPWGPRGLPAGLGWTPLGAFAGVRTPTSPAKPACWKCGLPLQREHRLGHLRASGRAQCSSRSGALGHLSARRGRISPTGTPKLHSVTGLGCAATYPLVAIGPQRPPWGAHGLPAGLGWAPLACNRRVRTRRSLAKPACWKCGSRYNGSIVWGICVRPDAPITAPALARSATRLQEGAGYPPLVPQSCIL